MNFEQLVKNILKRQKIKQKQNVVEIYLGKRDLESVSSLHQYKSLQRLWLNSNKLRNLICVDTRQSFLKENYKITELYLQNNDLCDIRGAIRHLSCLQILLLHKNQLAQLHETLHELRFLVDLRVLNLFDNPLAQESGYRILVIFSLPQVKLLDRREIVDSERKLGRQIYDAEREAIQSSIAFGRRTFIHPTLLHTLSKPPKKYLPPPTSTASKDKKQETKEKISHTLMQYTTFDWSRVPTSEQRRLGASVPAPQKLTVTIR